MYRFVLLLAFAVLFTGITVRLAFGGIDAAFVVAALFAAVFWWRWLVHVRRRRQRASYPVAG